MTSWLAARPGSVCYARTSARKRISRASPPRRSRSASPNCSPSPFGPQADSRTAIGSTVIDLTPGPVKEWAIQTFGTTDKLFLSVLVLGVIALLAAVTARWETRRVPVGSVAIVVAGDRGMCGGALACRGDAVRHRAHRGRHRLRRRGVAAAHLGTVRRRAGADRGPRRPPTAVDDCRW